MAVVARSETTLRRPDWSGRRAAVYDRCITLAHERFRELALQRGRAWWPARTRAAGAHMTEPELTDAAARDRRAPGVCAHPADARAAEAGAPASPREPSKKRGMPRTVLPKLRGRPSLHHRSAHPDAGGARLARRGPQGYDLPRPGERRERAAPRSGGRSGRSRREHRGERRADVRPRTTSMPSRCRRTRNPCIHLARCAETSSRRSPWSSSWTPPAASTPRRS